MVPLSPTLCGCGVAAERPAPAVRIAMPTMPPKAATRDDFIVTILQPSLRGNQLR